jgi:O-6-methylguanine DNA methyltransferase
MKFIEIDTRKEREISSDIYYSVMNTPVGELVIASTNRGLLRIILPIDGSYHPQDRLRNDSNYYGTLVEDDEKNRLAIDQLLEYFQGMRHDFALPVELRGTDFQISVWKAVARVPYGQTRSYGEIARGIGKPKASRAVGAANGANPIPIVIPCHRIIGADGSMTGFGGGIVLKEKLLQIEK